MSARMHAMEDRDWWMPHAMLAAFAVLVAAILRLLFGWTAPLHAWIALSGFAMATLAAHAGWRAAHCAMRRRWHQAGLAVLFAAALASMAAAMLLAGRTHLRVGGVLIDAPLVDDEAAR